MQNDQNRKQYQNMRLDDIAPLGPEALKLVDEQILSKARFLDSLINMREEPYEIEFYVNELAELVQFRSMSMMLQHGYTTEMVNLFMGIKHFYQYALLDEHPNVRYKISTVSKKLLERFIAYVIVKPPLAKVSGTDIDLYDVLHFMFLSLQNAGYNNGSIRQLKSIKALHVAALKKAGLPVNKELQRSKQGTHVHSDTTH